MLSNQLDIFNILSYGIIGLGALLAMLAYKLLITEQRIVRPRKHIINSVYVFMGFSIVLISFGLSKDIISNIFSTDSKIQGSPFYKVNQEIEKDHAALSIFSAENVSKQSLANLKGRWHISWLDEGGKLLYIKDSKGNTQAYQTVLDIKTFDNNYVYGIEYDKIRNGHTWYMGIYSPKLNSLALYYWWESSPIIGTLFLKFGGVKLDDLGKNILTLNGFYIDYYMFKNKMPVGTARLEKER